MNIHRLHSEVHFLKKNITINDMELLFQNLSVSLCDTGKFTLRLLLILYGQLNILEFSWSQVNELLQTDDFITWYKSFYNRPYCTTSSYTVVYKFVHSRFFENISLQLQQHGNQYLFIFFQIYYSVLKYKKYL